MAILTPLNNISPSVISYSPVIVLPSVDLPHPDSPTNPKVSPFLILKVTPSTAC